MHRVKYTLFFFTRALGLTSPFLEDRVFDWRVSLESLAYARTPSRIMLIEIWYTFIRPVPLKRVFWHLNLLALNCEQLLDVRPFVCSSSEHFVVTSNKTATKIANEYVSTDDVAEFQPRAVIFNSPSFLFNGTYCVRLCCHLFIKHFTSSDSYTCLAYPFTNIKNQTEKFTDLFLLNKLQRNV